MQRGSRKCWRQVLCEPLESRQLLAASAVISEFMAVNDSTLADDDGEFSDWIEIHNPTAQSLSLRDWYLTDDADNLQRWQFPDVTLEPGEYRIIHASGKNRTDTAQPLHTDFRLTGGGEFLAIVRPDGLTVEHAYAPQYPPQIADVSFGVSSDTDLQGFFAVPTPGSANGQLPTDDPLRTVVVNEIMYHPASQQTADEFIELYNRGSREVNLRGWRLSNGVDFVFPDVSLASEEYLVVAANVDAFRATYGNAANVVGPWTGQLSNRSDTITLRDELDRRIDRVTYADEGDWSQRARGPFDHGTEGWIWLDDHDGGGKSLELVNASMPNQFGQNWGPSQPDHGTPGAANSIVSNDIAPLILDTSHAPIIPGSSDMVTVTARIIDEADPVDVTLNWRVDGEDPFTQVAMRDDGQNGDRFADDRVFFATIPPHADLTVIEFFVQAHDPSGLSRSWPAETSNAGQTANALYQVLDSFDPDAIWQPGSHPTYYEVMTAAERETFQSINRASEAQMNATFISVNADGVQVRYNAGVRIRGSGSRNANPPNNRINIPSDRPWEGVTAINLNVTTIQDQIAGSALFRFAGLPAADAKAVTLIINGRNLMDDVRNLPFYVHVEPLNSDFAAKHFPDDANGNLYKGRRPNESPPGGAGAGLAYHGPDPAPYVSYVKLTNANAADWSDVIQLTDVLNNAPDETYLQDVAQVADIDQWLRFMGLNSLLGNTEGGLVNGDRFGDDYAMYRGVEDPRFRMVPHDLDSLFSDVTRDILRATNVPALGRLMLHPDIRPRYYQHLRDLIHNVLLSDDAKAVVEESLRDVQTPNQINTIFNYMRNRANYVLSVIPEGVQLESHLLERQGLRMTTEATAELHGLADFRAKSVTINGQLAAFDTRNRWQLGSFIRTVLPRVEWTYLDNGTDPGTEWKDLDFVPNDNWKVGRSQLGYGDRDEATVVSFGDDPDNKHITTYFRHEFDLQDAARYLSLNLSLLRDDGAVAYLNGTPVVRSNMPSGEINAQTLAVNNIAGGNERQFHDFEVDPSLLREGKNVIAVEVHQVDPTSADLSFDLRLTGRFRQPGGIVLQPGVNRLVVRAMSEELGRGEVIASEFIDVWYDDGSVQPVTENLPSGSTVWSSAAGPYEVRGEIVVPADGTLTIQPGTSVYFAPDAKLIVHGTLSAVGTADRRIRLTSIPGTPWVPDLPGLPDGPARWSGIHFIDSPSAANHIAFADIEYAQDPNGSLGVESSSLVVDNVSFAGTHRRMIYGSNASLVVRNSFFPDMFAEDEDPAELKLDNVSEQIKVIGRTPAGGQLRIEGNEFGTNKGHNDVIDADSNRVTQGPILQIVDNVFHGSGDELLDLGGDVYVAGNLFRNVFKDDSTSDRGYANAISTGDAGANTTVVVARNVFYNVDHAINLKNRAATIFENNTVVTVHPDFVDRFGHTNVASAINLFVDEPTGTPASGAYAAGNIFWDVPRVFGNVDLPGDHVSHLQFENNLVSAALAESAVGQRPGTLLSLGRSTRIGDPRLSDPVGGDFSLRAGSAAVDGVLGQNYGADVPAGAWISGEPPATTFARSASLTVGGPGIFAFRYRVNGGDYSDPIPIGSGFDVDGTIRTATIELDDLAEGSYTVEVLGQDFAGNWQTQPTMSRTWTVQADAGDDGLVISEVLASNQTTLNHFGTYPDMIELHNTGSSSVNLRGYGLSDEADDPGKFVFRQDLVLGPGDRLRVFADRGQTPGLHTGFALSQEGEGVYLYAPVRAGARELVDSVEFGIQVPDFSIGRVGPEQQWALTLPSFGAPNRPALTGDVQSLKINEWLAQSTSGDDFLELYNPDRLPVALGGLYLSDAVDGTPLRHRIAPLSFIAGRGFTALIADGASQDGADHLGFRLSLDQEALGLVDQQLNLIDTVVYQPQTPGVSQGRMSDGAASFQFFDQPSPGWANGTGVHGDANQDGQLNVNDIHTICEAIRLETPPNAILDLNRDSSLTTADLRHFVEVIMQTHFGDANLDGIFDSSDIVLVFAGGQYEDRVPQNSSWSEGDWNCDGEFTSSDLLVAFQGGGYTAAAAARAVPRDPTFVDRRPAGLNPAALKAAALKAAGATLRPSLAGEHAVVAPRPAAIVMLEPETARPRPLHRWAPFAAEQPARTDWYFAIEDPPSHLGEDELLELLAIDRSRV